MSPRENAPRRFVGFDVAKDTITVFDSASGRTDVIDNQPRAITARLRALEATPGATPDSPGPGADGRILAVCAPTGGYERLLLDRLLARGIPCHRADTRKVKAFIRSYGTLAKTDALDARALARYAEERWPTLAPYAPPDVDQLALAELVGRRHDLVALKVAETNRAHAPTRARTHPGAGRAVKASCQAMLRTLAREIDRIERQIDALLVGSQHLARRVATMASLQGVGPRTAIALAALMPELGSLSRRQAASLAGVAPHPKDSGKHSGYRAMRGGRPNLRPVLFMAALAASRTQGPLKATYRRLIDNGKKPILAIAALMRRIVVILNARLRDDALQQS